MFCSKDIDTCPYAAAVKTEERRMCWTPGLEPHELALVNALGEHNSYHLISLHMGGVGLCVFFYCSFVGN